MRERKGERSYCTQYGTSSTGRGAPGKTGLHVRTYVYVYTASYIERRGRGAFFSCSSAPNVLSKERNVGR